jgi:hypothetical protein
VGADLGPTATIAKPDELRTDVSGIRGPATLKFRLTGSDPVDGTSASATVTVTVKAPK